MSRTKLKQLSYVWTNHQNFSSRNGEKISRITIHHAAGVNASFEGLKGCIQTRECSFNYGVQSDGKIGMFVDEDYRAWTSSNGDNDRKAITIEVANSSGNPDWRISDAAYSTVLDLCEDICRRYNIPGLTYTGKLKDSNLTMHCWFASTGCPGPYLKSKFPDIAREVNRRLGTTSNLVYDNYTGENDSAYYAAIDGMFGYSNAEDLIDYDKLTPYIAYVPASVTKFDVKALKDCKVSGVLLYAGRLYDVVHMPKSITEYRNNNLAKQVKLCNDNNMPYGLLHNLQARNKDEARKECAALRRTVQLFPPELGVWLDLHLSASKTTNDEILDTYYAYLVKNAGLQNRLGIYCNKDMLSKISWETKHNQNYMLWLVDHISSTSEISGLLNPDFFNVCD